MGAAWGYFRLITYLAWALPLLLARGASTAGSCCFSFSSGPEEAPLIVFVPDAGAGDGSGDSRGADTAATACTDSCVAQTHCRTGTCVAGLCHWIAAAAGTACDDGAACTVGDVCNASGSCEGIAMDCDDGDVCTADSCLKTGGCVHDATVKLNCDDGDSCTISDRCAAGSCLGSPLDCSDGNPCTVDACTVPGGCSYSPANMISCDDGNACTAKDKCSNGACAGKPVDCKDLDACTTDSCGADGGCVHLPVTTKACDDGNACTIDSCASATGCANLALSVGAACDTDGSKCTPESCAAGICTKGGVVGCDDNNPCTKDACNATTGLCSHVKVSDGAGCDDGDACTLSDACAAGACKGLAKVCAATEVCVAGSCKVGAPAGMVLIPAGSFKMGCVPTDKVCPYVAGEKPQHTVFLDAFYMDVFEVTVEKYKQCVDAGKCSKPDELGYCGHKYLQTYGAAGKDQHPVNCITWPQADAYCKWSHAKGRLPTEAEWEKAARGGLEGKIYPWGDQLTCSHAVWTTSSIPDAGTGPGCAGTTTLPVGSKPAGKNGYGLYDMAGNVSEWLNDWYAVDYYAVSPASNPPGAASGGNKRVIRGGDFSNKSPFDLRTSRRTNGDWPAESTTLGFRCARSLP